MKTLPILFVFGLFFATSTSTNAQAVSATDNCDVAITTTKTYQRWRTTTVAASNRIPQAIRVFNLDCLRNIINIPGLNIPAIPSLSSIIQALANRICQVVLNTVTDNSELSSPIPNTSPNLYIRPRIYADTQLQRYS